MGDSRISKADLLAKANDIAQVASVTRHTGGGGKASGIRSFDVETGSGLRFTVLESKCLDIHKASFKGTNISFLSKAGLAGPEYFNPYQGEFNYYFQGGLLYTCGLSNVGPANTEGGRAWPLHGRINNQPAENAGASCCWTGDGRYEMTVSGTMRQAGLFEENLSLSRRITTELYSKKITIEDTIENSGYSREPLMVLYHFNLGYPLLDAGSRFLLGGAFTTAPRDDAAKAGIARFGVMEEPSPKAPEQVFYHIPDKNGGKVAAALVNDRLGLGVYIKFDPKQLPVLAQWKSFASGDYAMGIEPGNCMVGGRDKELARGGAEYLEPAGIKKVSVEIGVLDGADEIDRFAKHSLTGGQI